MAQRCDHTPAWAALAQAYDAQANSFNLRTAFAADAQRFAHFSQQAPQVFADLSKNLIDAPLEALLLDLARQCGVAERRDAMFAGEAINSTENRAVMHFLLRNPPIAQDLPGHSAPDFVANESHKVHATLRAVGLRQRGPGGRVVTPLRHYTASISCSSFTASAAKARMPSASFSVAMASALWA